MALYKSYVHYSKKSWKVRWKRWIDTLKINVCFIHVHAMLNWLCYKDLSSFWSHLWMLIRLSLTDCRCNIDCFFYLCSTYWLKLKRYRTGVTTPEITMKLSLRCHLWSVLQVVAIVVVYRGKVLSGTYWQRRPIPKISKHSCFPTATNTKNSLLHLSD